MVGPRARAASASSEWRGLRGDGRWARAALRAGPLTVPPRSVTDAAQLWSTCFPPDSLAALVGNGPPGRAGPYGPPTGWIPPKGLTTPMPCRKPVLA